ncbi:MAG: threonine synthase [Opitutales bacterium]|nr:threonine synthase [Opitutales bacterium]
MKYISTRGGSEPVSFSEAVARGLAPDGGLYLPQIWPDITPLLAKWEWLSYADLCEEFFALFCDLPRDVLSRIVKSAYSRFDSPQIAPMLELDSRTYVLELFHGPTLAFKDFALQLLGGLYEEQIRRTGRPITVLGATSGDTGAAAIHGLIGREGVNIFILYPDGRVSPLQERQMTCTGAANVFPLAINGTFDDAQSALKDVFNDAAFKDRVGLSAVNSINIARILAQCVYYIHAWLHLPVDKRDNVEFVVPTGNFGNVLAGWMAQRMGLPAKSFRVATNQNDILYRFFKTGRYELGPVHPSHAPSMDIQVASNFERFIYFLLGESAEKTRAVMEQFKKDGSFEFSGFDSGVFRASRADDADIVRLICEVKQKYDYVTDPHTACAFAELDPERVSVILSTAHPAKFPSVIRDAIGVDVTHSTLEALKNCPIVKHSVKAEKSAIESFIDSKLA